MGRRDNCEGEKIKEIKEVCRGVLEYGEHILPRIDTEIF